MSDQQKRELVDQIAGLIAQANTRQELMFQTQVSSDAYGVAGSNLDNILTILGEYRVSLSVPQTIWNTRAAHMVPERIEQIYPELMKKASECLFNPRGSGFIETLGTDIHEVARQSAPTDENMLRQIFERESDAARVPVFTIPKGMNQEEIESICADLATLLECYRHSWEDYYNNQDEDTDPDDAHTDEDRMGFYGAVQWVMNVVGAVHEQSQSKAAYLDAQSVPKTGHGLLKPPGALLN